MVYLPLERCRSLGFGARILALVALFAVGSTPAGAQGVTDFGTSVPTVEQLRSATGLSSGGIRGVQILPEQPAAATARPSQPVSTNRPPPSMPSGAPPATSASPTPQMQQSITAPPIPTPQQVEAAGFSMRIQFDLNSAQVRQDFMPHLSRIAELLREEPSLRFHIVGHADASGAASYNLTLSQQRAVSVKNVLTQIYGIPASRFTFEGRGEYEPVVGNPYDPINRRVEFLVR